MEEEYLEFAKEIAFKAGEIMKKYFKTDNGATYKGDKTIVTIADKEINSYLIKRVKETYPNHSVDGEEETFGESNYVWVCDPIDGTAMYARHIPVAVFSLALVIDGTAVVSTVYDVFTDNLYTAIKGKGAYKNNEKIHVNDYETNDMKSVSNYDMWPSAKYNTYDIVKEFSDSYFVNIGSVIRACMCVSTGDFVCSIFPGTGRKNCDIAASKLIVEEAGGEVTNFFGENERYDRPINGAIISNGKVHNEILKVIGKYYKNNKNPNY